MIPLYIITLTVIGISTWQWFAQRKTNTQKPGRKIQTNLKTPNIKPALSKGRLVLVVLTTIFVFLGVGLAAAFPVPRIRPPEGKLKVGTTSFSLLDAARQEIWADNPNLPRSLMLQAWYPTENTANLQKAPWMDNIEIIAPKISEWIGMPDWFLSHLQYSLSNSYLDAPLSNALEKYPVVLFSHGRGGFRAQNTFQFEALASEGIVVISIEHPYGSVVSIFPDGSVANFNPNNLPPDETPLEEYEITANILVSQWVEDIGFVLDALALNNQAGPAGFLANRLDLNRVGLMGHSTGGAAITEFCADDPRCIAGLGLDTWTRPISKQVLSAGPQQPFVFMFSSDWPSERNWELFNELYSTSSKSAAFVIEGTDHYDFTDLPALSPFAPQLGLKGPLNAARVQTIILDYTTTFFKRAFSSDFSSPWLPQTDYSEVRTLPRP